MCWLVWPDSLPGPVTALSPRPRNPSPSPGHLGARHHPTPVSLTGRRAREDVGPGWQAAQRQRLGASGPRKQTQVARCRSTDHSPLLGPPGPLCGRLCGQGVPCEAPAALGLSGVPGPGQVGRCGAGLPVVPGPGAHPWWEVGRLGSAPRSACGRAPGRIDPPACRRPEHAPHARDPCVRLPAASFLPAEHAHPRGAAGTAPGQPGA